MFCTWAEQSLCLYSENLDPCTSLRHFLSFSSAVGMRQESLFLSGEMQLWAGALSWQGCTLPNCLPAAELPLCTATQQIPATWQLLASPGISRKQARSSAPEKATWTEISLCEPAGTPLESAEPSCEALSTAAWRKASNASWDAGGTQGICMRLSDMTQDRWELSILQATLEICLWAAEIIPRCLPQCNKLNCFLGLRECFDFIDYDETLNTAPRRVPKFSSADKKAVNLWCPLPLLHRVCRVSFKQEPLPLGNMFICFFLLALDHIEHLWAPQLHLFASKWCRDDAV